jgi:EAL domain-containing protein (putative c-di-GMP-specific phosphodiesterase class I)/GGDEF domain-containing protein
LGVGQAAALPAAAEAIDAARALILERGELIVLYFSFVRFATLEEVYGWEKLDLVLETSAAAVRECLRESALGSSQAMVVFPRDDDFVFLHVPAAGVAAASDAEVTEIAGKLQRFVTERIEAVHGEEIAALTEIYAGRSHVYYDPKVRVERLIYRGIREAATAARSIETRERARRAGELRESIRERAIYIDYHPIVVAASGQVFGYEALARGLKRGLRSPEVMFEVAADAKLIWELSRLCRAKALEGFGRLGPTELLFVNVDPHDFDDPQLSEPTGAHDPHRVVLEITERTAIKDYPRFRERLQAFREAGYRVAVDDAGSGYAGLGSIANLEPNFIKLDRSLITGIDRNPTKRNLVETMVRFANEQGAMVIAEGVEGIEEYAAVRSLGVHLVQGFFVNRLREEGVDLADVVANHAPSSSAQGSSSSAQPPSSRAMSATDRSAAPNP